MYKVSRHPQVIAHRGFSGAYPENTHSAILGAIDVGADMVEIDVRISRDGIPVVVHDAVLGGRTRPHRRTEECTVAELKRLDISTWKGEHFRGERIMTLAEALALTRDRIPVNLDIKTAAAIVPAIELVRTQRMLGQTVFSGCSGKHVRCARQLEPQLHVLMNVDDHLRTLLRLCSARVALLVSWLQARKVQAAGLNIGHHIAADRFIRDASACNLPVWTWTVDDPARALDLAHMGAVSITSNWPDRILAVFPAR